MRIVVSGPRARFADTSTHDERDGTYPVITPAAAKGILDAIWWHRQILWVVDRIVVLNPIRTARVMTQKTANGTTGRLRMREVETLVDVAYGIEAHFERTEHWKKPGSDGRPYTDGKVLAITSRRIRQGRHKAYLGSPDCPATVRQVTKFPRSHYQGQTIDLGNIPCQTACQQGTPPRNHVIMRDGIIDLTSKQPEAPRHQDRPIRE